MDWQGFFKIGSMQREAIANATHPLDHFRSLAERPLAMMLFDPEGVSFVATEPLLVLTADNDKTQLKYQGGVFEIAKSPYAVMDQLLESFNQDTSFSVSMFGYLGYESSAHFEKKFRSDQPNPYGMADLSMVLYADVMIFEKRPQGYSAERISLTLKGPNSELLCPMSADTEFGQQHDDKAADIQWKDLSFSRSPKGLQSTMSREEYIEKVNLLKSLICSGEVYQGNLTQLMKCPFAGRGLELMEQLYKINPASYFAYINLGEQQVISSSPENFLHLAKGELSAHPIKGTIGRGETPEEDQNRLNQLLTSNKDAAELSMIVDLFRNDFNRVCRPGSVQVERHKFVEPLNNVYHLVSEVRGTLGEGRSVGELLAATFPSGSITGCPKIRSVEVLRDLEPTRRSVYSGAIGRISHRDLNLNVAIRTLIKRGEEIYFQVGGGIVYDSDAEKEYEETLDKARPFFTAVNFFQQSEEDQRRRSMNILFDGNILDERNFSGRDFFTFIDHPLLNSSHGCFETLLVEGDGRIQFLHQHLARARTTLVHPLGLLGSGKEGSPSLANVEAALKEFVESNANGQRQRLKVLFFPPIGERDFSYLAYLQSLPSTNSVSEACRLGLYHDQEKWFADGLCEHKLLNYWPHRTLKQQAQQQGLWDMLRIADDGRILETSCANIFLLFDDVWLTPPVSGILPGIIRGEILKSKKLNTAEREIFEKDLPLCRAAFLTNSIVGIQPVTQIADHHLATENCNHLYNQIFD